jgi:hypothetical protein
MTARERKRFAVKQDDEERKGYDQRWEQLNKKLKEKRGGEFEEPKFPFAPTNLIRDYNSLYQKIYDKEKYVNM